MRCPLSIRETRLEVPNVTTVVIEDRYKSPGVAFDTTFKSKQTARVIPRQKIDQLIYILRKKYLYVRENGGKDAEVVVLHLI